MKFEKPTKLKDLAAHLNCEFEGDPDFTVTGINEIHVVKPGEITFVDHPKYYSTALSCPASVIFIDRKVERPEGKHLVFCDDPFSKFKQIILENSSFKPAVSPVSKSAKIGTGTVLQPGVFVGENVVIGNNCLIHPNVVIYQDTVIGDNVIIHANTTIGSDAFYMKRRPDYYEKFPTCGKVIIEDDVEIGSGCTIDRGVTNETIIGKGTKIDSQVHIGHDTIIGKHCIIAAQVGIAGVVKVEDFVMIWGQVGIDRDVTIGKGASILAKSGVGKSLEGGKSYFGSPAYESKESMKSLFLTRRLQEIIDRIDKLENRNSE